VINNISLYIKTIGLGRGYCRVCKSREPQTGGGRGGGRGERQRRHRRRQCITGQQLRDARPRAQSEVERSRKSGSARPQQAALCTVAGLMDMACSLTRPKPIEVRNFNNIYDIYTYREREMFT